VIAFAVVRASALRDLGPAGLVVVAFTKLKAAGFHADHGSHRIN